MADLSPAAQAIVDVAVEAGGGYGRATPTLHARLAAALRAVTDQLGEELEFYNQAMVSVDDLLAIAAELDNSAQQS
jgi:hypothetical protein